MRTRLEVIRLANNDVIATSGLFPVTNCGDAYGFIGYDGSKWQLYKNGVQFQNYEEFTGNAADLNSSYMYHVNGSGEIVGRCKYNDPDDAHVDHNRPEGA